MLYRNIHTQGSLLLGCFIAVYTILSLSSCARSEDPIAGGETEINKVEVFGEGLSETELLPQMNINVDDGLCSELEHATDADGWVDLSAFPQFRSQGVVKMRRLFPHAGEFEQRTRAAGLHRWYVLSYDENKVMTKAANGLAAKGILEVEYCPKIEIVGNPSVVEYCSAPEIARMASSASFPFDDPMLKDQWHYYNKGTAASSVSGCDINVLPVWEKYKTYSNYNGDIVVSVVDGGVDYKHEDLKDNMWRNPDKTGDNVYGYNFAANNYAINPEDHGTHVAGTIAAINNNGKGVCGVAGGDKKKKIKGAKIMSCQIFDGKSQGSGAEAIKWGADHGAVISQNSWGYTNAVETPTSLKLAVDYFIQNAGVDSKGKQTGPMRGGIVIFAAGNDNSSVSGNSYNKIFCVAALGADYKRAYYSNYGSWVDVAAPGGDAQKGNQVLSTLPGHRYGRMQGTSMACPHVSGVAALVLARFGGSGYTPEALEKAIVNNLTDVSSQNPAFYVGKGLVNAYKAIAGSGGKAPEKPEDLQIEAQSNNIKFSVKVPSDDDDGKPVMISIYYAKKDFSSTKGALFGSFYVEDVPVGGTLEGTISGTEFETQYYVAAVAVDLAGNKSAMTERKVVTTGKNSNPQIVSKSAVEFKLKAHESAVALFDVIEPDGHFYQLAIEPESPATILDTFVVRECPKIIITAQEVPEGKYQAKLVVTDIYGAVTEQNVDYTVLPNHKPVIVKPFEVMKYTSKTAGTTDLKATDFFNDEDGEELKYSFEFSNEYVANMTYSANYFHLTPMSYGNSDITVTGTDVRGESISQVIRVMVADCSKELTLFPNPVVDILNIRTGKDVKRMGVKLVSGTGAIVYENGFDNANPFEPIEIDMTLFPSGSYCASVDMDGKLINTTIIKL